MSNLAGAEAGPIAGQDTGILIHGRDLNAPDAFPLRMLWGLEIEGDGPERKGTIPAAALAMLDAQPERIRVVTIGSGASEHEGPDGQPELEADYIKRLMIERFDELETFPSISEHPNWQNETSRQVLARVIAEARTDTEAGNTKEEIYNAATLFGSLGVKRAIQVSSISHGPRCLLDRTSVELHNYPATANQHWSIVTDDEPFTFGMLDLPLILEVPHRRGDPRLQWPEGHYPSEFMRDFFQMTDEQQLLFAMCSRDFIDRTLKSGNLDWFKRQMEARPEWAEGFSQFQKTAQRLTEDSPEN